MDTESFERRGGFDDRLQRVEVAVAVMKSDHQQMKEDMRQVRTLLDASAGKQARIYQAVVATLITTLLGAFGFVMWEVITRGLRT